MIWVFNRGFEMQKLNAMLTPFSFGLGPLIRDRLTQQRTYL